MKSVLVLLIIVSAAVARHIRVERSVGHRYGNAISVYEAKENGTHKINENVFDKLFSHPELKDRKPVIISILGAFRKGKSFFLDYCLRYLYANVSF